MSNTTLPILSIRAKGTPPPLQTKFLAKKELGEGGQKKNRKKLTNVSLVCMYVGRKSEMSVFFCFFFPAEVIYRLFQWSLRKKTEKCQFLCSMYVCKAKTNICQFFSVFFHAPFPKSRSELNRKKDGTKLWCPNSLFFAQGSQLCSAKNMKNMENWEN